MDKREYVQDQEEAIRTVFEGLMRGHAKVMPCLMSADTADGHSCEPQPSIQRSVTDPVSGLQSFLDHPIAVDVPIHYAGGGGVTATHPVKKGDEGIVVYADRALDVVRQQGGTAQPIDNRQHHLGDGLYIPGIRTDPRKLMQVSNDAHHVRSDDKKHVSEVHPQNGITHKSVDPSTAIASLNFDPFTMATKFFSHTLNPTSGILGQAVDGAISHTHGIAHDLGAFMTALSGAHSVLAHPQNGASMNAANLLHRVLAHPTDGLAMLAENGLHQVLAHPSIGAALMGQNGASSVIATASLALKSATGISLSCPAGGLSLPSGSVGGSSLGAGAAAQNVGQVGGDLSGTLPDPTVTSLHVDFSQYPSATSDALAAAAGVPVGGLYRDTSIAAGKSVLVVRMA